VYVGDPARYLAGQPTFRASPRGYNGNSLRFWRPLQRVLPAHPVALLMDAYNPLFGPTARAHPDWIVGPGVIAVTGPRPAIPVAEPLIPTGPRGVPQGVVLGAGTLVVVTLIGVGWAVALLPAGVRPFEVLALSPAMGFAVLLLAGVLIDALGVRLGGVGGGLTGPVAAAAGAVAASVRLRHDGGSLFAGT
jgi:hypothetical protein